MTSSWELVLAIQLHTEKRMLCYSIQQHWYISPVQDNVATPVTAIMMVTVCISADALSSVFISPDVSDTNSFHQRCWSIMPVLTDCNSLFPTYTCIILLHQTDTALTTQQTVPVWCRQFWTVWYSYDIAPVSGLKVQQAVTGLWRFSLLCRVKSNYKWFD